MDIERELERIRPKLVSMSLRYLTRGDRDLAEDIVQEALFRALRRKSEIRTEEVDAYVWTAAKRVAHDMRRAAARKPTCQLIEEAADIMPDHAPGPHELLLQKDRAQWLADVIATLSPMRKEALTLRAQGRTMLEIAELTGVSQVTARTRVLRARHALRQTLS